MFAKLALRNVRRQVSNYLIYFVTVAMSVALMFAVNNLTYSAQLIRLAKDNTDIGNIIKVVTIFASVVTALVLSYAAAFMLKLRKKEFGMYLTLGMTRKNIQILFSCETGILSGMALAVGMGMGLVIYQLVMALFSFIMETSFSISAYSVKGIGLTLAVSIGMFVVSSLAAVRYLKKVTVYELLKVEKVEKGEKHPVFWCVLAVLLIAGMVFCFVNTYQSMIAAFYGQEGLELLLWLALDLVMFFLTHVAMARTITGILLKKKKLKNSRTNTVILRRLSGKMTVNSMMIGALATLFIFAIVMSNVAFGEKIYVDRSIDKDCPYDVMASFDENKEHGITLQEGKKIIEGYSPILSQMDYGLYSLGETTICSSVMGYEEMGWTDRFMPLSQFNMLLVDCGYEPLILENEYMVITQIQGICDVDFSDKIVTLNGNTYSCAGSSASFPSFTRKWLYFVIPDDAVSKMAVSDTCVAYTLENHRPDALALVEDLCYVQETDYGMEEMSDYMVREYINIYSKANAGVLIIGALYISTVFVCMALAILALKTLSTLDDERRQFAILYRLGADVRLQKKTLFKQTGAFFLMPFVLPFLMTIPVGAVMGKVYEKWDLVGVSRQMAMGTASVVSFAILGVYVLYFIITYRIACEHVICYGNEK